MSSSPSADEVPQAVQTETDDPKLLDWRFLSTTVSLSMVIALGVLAVPAALEASQLIFPTLQVPIPVYLIVYGALTCFALWLLEGTASALAEYLSPKYSTATLEWLLTMVFGEGLSELDKEAYQRRFWTLQRRSRREQKLRAAFEGNALAVQIGLVLGSLLVFSVSFSQLCRFLYLSYGGFTSTSATYFHWLRFGPVGAIDNTLFGFMGIFGLQGSDIQATSLWSKLVVLAFTAVLQIAVISGVIGTILLVAIEQEVRVGQNLPEPIPMSYSEYLSRTAWFGLKSLPWIVAIAVLVSASGADQLSAPNRTPTVW